MYMHLRQIVSGARVRISTPCPIDFEGVGPVAGDIGRVVALSGGTRGRGTVAVEFERFGSPWIIPSRFLELVD